MRVPIFLLYVFQTVHQSQSCMYGNKGRYIFKFHTFAIKMKFREIRLQNININNFKNRIIKF